MTDYNFKVVAELKDDLSSEQKLEINIIIERLSEKLKIVKISENEYCKAQPISNQDDFGAVCGFFYMLKKKKALFSKLVYYDLALGDVSVAV